MFSSVWPIEPFSKEVTLAREACMAADWSSFCRHGQTFVVYVFGIFFLQLMVDGHTLSKLSHVGDHEGRHPGSVSHIDRQILAWWRYWPFPRGTIWMGQILLLPGWSSWGLWWWMPLFSFAPAIKGDSCVCCIRGHSFVLTSFTSYPHLFFVHITQSYSLCGKGCQWPPQLCWQI